MHTASPIAEPALRSPLTRRIRRALLDARSPLTNRRVLALCSGGADSIALVALLAELPRGAAPASIHVLWLDHAQRPANRDERDAAERAAERCGASFHAAAAMPGEIAQLAAREARERGVQDACREWRYREARRMAQQLDCDVVVTGHTADDQLELALLQLVGAVSSPAMPIARDLAPGIRLVRPLLGIERREIVEYLTDVELAWANDPTNDTDAYVRNRIRHDVVPALLAASDASPLALSQRVAPVDNERRAARELAEALLDARADAADSLDVRDLTRLSTHARSHLIAAWLERNGLRGELHRRHVSAIVSLIDPVQSPGRTRQIDLPNHTCVWRDGYHLIITTLLDKEAAP